MYYMESKYTFYYIRRYQIAEKYTKEITILHNLFVAHQLKMRASPKIGTVKTGEYQEARHRVSPFCFVTIDVSLSDWDLFNGLLS